MKLLLDTHAFLWWIGNDNRLSDTARKVISNVENDVFISTASVWEMAVKTCSGKLSINSELAGFMKKHLAKNAFSILPISLAHALQIAKLPTIHRDPFDRMLVAQAQVEKARLVSTDPEIHKYAVDICW